MGVDCSVIWPSADGVEELLHWSYIAGKLVERSEPSCESSGVRALGCGLRRELGQIADLEGGFQPRDLGHGVLETVFTEPLVLLLFERLAELAVRGPSDHAPKRRKQHGVLARRVGPIHTHESAGCFDEP